MVVLKSQNWLFTVVHDICNLIKNKNKIKELIDFAYVSVIEILITFHDFTAGKRNVRKESIERH